MWRRLMPTNRRTIGVRTRTPTNESAPYMSRTRFAPLIVFVALLAFGTTGCGNDHADPSRTDVERSSPTEFSATVAAPVDDPSRPSPSTALSCSGEGAIPVLFLAGARDPVAVWDRLVDQLGDDVRACRFDPTGIGASPEPDQPVTPTRRAEALDAALTSAEIDVPVVLVAHSLGGRTARRFGTSHPDRLAGAVLLDPTTRLALLSLREDLVGDGWDPDATIADAEAPSVWPDVPLIVLSHDPALMALGSEAVEALWTEGQEEYLALSPSSRREVVVGSGHYIYRDALGAVAEAIHEIVAAAG